MQKIKPEISRKSKPTKKASDMSAEDLEIMTEKKSANKKNIIIEKEDTNMDVE